MIDESRIIEAFHDATTEIWKFQCAIKDGYFPVHEEWFCADGVKKND